MRANASPAARSRQLQTGGARPRRAGAPPDLPRLALYATLAGLVLHGSAAYSSQSSPGFLPVGVRYQAADDPDVRQRDLAMMRQVRFTVVELSRVGESPDRAQLMFIDRLIARAPDPRVVLPLGAPAVIAIEPRTQAAQVTADAWTALARGAAGIIFAEWTTLLGNPGALAAAAQFAEVIARNAALYAPLRPVSAPPGERLVQVAAGGDAVDAWLLESAATLVLIAVNRTDRQRAVTLTFSPDVPEAIWQNMLGSGAVSFVAGPDGPIYERTFPPLDVLVLVIKKGRR